MLRDCDGTTTNSIAVEVEVRTTLGPKAVSMECAASIAGLCLHMSLATFVDVYMSSYLDDQG